MPSTAAAAAVSLPATVCVCSLGRNIETRFALSITIFAQIYANERQNSLYKCAHTRRVRTAKDLFMQISPFVALINDGRLLKYTQTTLIYDHNE
jgi:hypothetical protein